MEARILAVFQLQPAKHQPVNRKVLIPNLTTIKLIKSHI